MLTLRMEWPTRGYVGVALLNFYTEPMFRQHRAKTKR